MTIRELRSADELIRYLAFAAEVYRDIPAWIRRRNFVVYRRDLA